MAIEKYKNGWRVNVHTGKTAADLPAPYTGKPRLTKVVTSSRRDAEQVEREFKQMVVDARKGSAEISANDFKDEFLNLCERTSTRQTYDFALRRFLAEYGDKPLAHWDEREARRAASSLAKGNVIVVKTFFTRAVERGHIARNPFRDIAPSTGRQVKTKEDFHKLWPLDAGKQRELFSSIIDAALSDFGPDEAALVAWQGWVGNRPGEAFALSRENVDLAADLATIDSHYDRATGESVPGTKNHLSRIVVVAPIPELRNALAAMPVRIDSPLMFTNDGRQWTQPTWHDRWKQIRKTAGVPKMRFYDLRHFCATQLLELGVDAADVAVQLGHTDGGELVRTVYGHPSEDAARDRIRHTLRTNLSADRHTVSHINEAKGA